MRSARKGCAISGCGKLAFPSEWCWVVLSTDLCLTASGRRYVLMSTAALFIGGFRGRLLTFDAANFGVGALMAYVSSAWMFQNLSARWMAVHARPS